MSGQLSGAQAVAVDAVVGAVGPQVGGQGKVAPGLGAAARLLEGAAEAEVREVVHRRALDHGAELLARLRVASSAEGRAPERLAVRGLVGIDLPPALHPHGSGGEV